MTFDGSMHRQLSEHATEVDDGLIRSIGFTGAFLGLWVRDLTGHGHHADFDQATYSARQSMQLKHQSGPCSINRDT